MEVSAVEVFAGHIKIEYSDGSREEVENGVYERKNASRRTVEERAATAADIERLGDLAAQFEAANPPSTASVVEVEVIGTTIEIKYADGTKEEIEAGVYELKDANNETILERTATAADIARLNALATGGATSDVPLPDPATIAKIEIFGGDIQVNYADGSKEEIEAGRYERKDTNNRTIEERTATANDVARLQGLVAGADAALVTYEYLLADGTRIETGVNKIEVTYPDGTREEIEAGRYERKDANNRTVEERPAVQADVDRLTALLPDGASSSGVSVGTGSGPVSGSPDDDGTPDQGSGDAPGTPTSGGSTDDDGTPDQGSGDAPGTPTSGGSTDDDGTPDQGSGDAPGTPTSGGSTDDDGTPDQGSGDAPGTPTSGGSTDDDGTPDQGSGDAPGTPTSGGSSDDDGTPDQGSGDAPGTPTSGGSSDDDGTPDQGSGDAPGTPGGDPTVPGPAPVEPTITGTDRGDRIKGTNDDDVIDGMAGNDRIRGGNGDDTVNGDAGNDRIRGDNGNDIVNGGSGNDDVRGDRGNDIVDGGDGNDRVIGGAGDDIIDGGAGIDRYWGGLGEDTFVFAADGAFDRIHDFQDGSDLIDLTAYGFADANEALSYAYENRGSTYFDFGDGDVLQVNRTALTDIDATDLIV